MGKIETAVRRIDNLYRAWAAVRSNVNASGQDKFKAEVKQISENPIPHLRRIQTQLQRRRFTFDEQHGVLKTKSTGKKRPIVVAPINHHRTTLAIFSRHWTLKNSNTVLRPRLQPGPERRPMLSPLMARP